MFIGGHSEPEKKHSIAKSSSETQIFNTQTLEWTSGPNLNTARSHMACAVFNEHIYVFGGKIRKWNKWHTQRESKYFETIEKLNVRDINALRERKTSGWETLGAQLSTTRGVFPAVSTPNGIYLLGYLSLSLSLSLSMPTGTCSPFSRFQREKEG